MEDHLINGSLPVSLSDSAMTISLRGMYQEASQAWLNSIYYDIMFGNKLV